MTKKISRYLALPFVLVLVSFLNDCWGQTERAGFAPPPGATTRPLDQAREALAEEDYASAIEFLSRVIGPDANEANLTEDYFLPTRRRYATRSVRSEANKLIANLPSRGRAVFELKYGIAAKKKLTEGIRTNDRDLINVVAVQYFHTRAGYLACFLLGKQYLADGDFQMARRYFEKLIKLEQCKRLLDPGLTIQYSISLAGIGDFDSALSSLRDLAGEKPMLDVLLNDQVVTLNLKDDQLAKRSLDTLVRPLFAPFEPGERFAIDGEWLSYRDDGNLAQAIEDQPLPVPVWSVPTWIDREENRVARLVSQRLQTPLPVIPVFQPVALKNTAVFRTPSGIFGVNNETGQLTWTYPWNHQESSKRPEESWRSKSEIERRLWTDSVSGRMSSDGSRVFFVEQLEQSLKSRSFERNFQRTSDVRANSLVCLQIVNEEGLAVEGQIGWRIDPKDAHPELSGAVFLGPPLIKEETAFVLIERGGQICLVALSATDGEFQWSQQLASTQSFDGIEQRIFRYGRSITPALMDGLLICPTMVGSLVAIDLTDRSLKWGFQYDRLDESSIYYETGEEGSFVPWQDQALFPIDDFLVFSPIDSESYYVIRRESGRIKLTRPKKNHWMIAGKYEDALVILGRDQVTMQTLKGFTQFKIDFSAHGQLVGTGFFAGQFLYLPLSNQKLIKIDLAERKVDLAIETAKPLGNLCQYNGRLISQSAAGLDSYWLGQSAMVENERNLAEKKNDAASWMLAAQLYAQKNQLDVAITCASRSVQRAANKLSSGYLTYLVAERFSNGGLINWKGMQMAYDLLTEPDQKRAFLLSKIEYHFAVGRPVLTLNDLLSLIDLYTPDQNQNFEFTNVGSQYSVNELRRVRSRLDNVVDQLDDERREQFVAELNAKFSRVVDSGNIQRIRLFMELLGNLVFPLEKPGRLVDAAAKSKSSKYRVWLEGILLQSLHDSQPVNTESQAVYQIRLLRAIWEIKKTYVVKEDELSLKIYLDFCRALLEKLKNRPQEFAQNYAAELSVDVSAAIKSLAKTTAVTAPDGLTRIDFITEGDADHLLMENGNKRFPGRQQSSNRIDPFPYEVGLDDGGAVYLRDREGKLVYFVESQKRGSRHLFPRFDYSNYQVLGDLLIVCCGHNHIAINLAAVISSESDSRDWSDPRALVGELQLTSGLADDYVGEEAVLWRHSVLPESSKPRPPRVIRQSNAMAIVSSQLTDPEGFQVGLAAKLSANSYCLLAYDRLVCLDPWTGKVTWQRGGIKAGSTLIGDGKFVYVLSPDDLNVLVLRAIDGEELGEHSVEANTVNRLATCDSCVVSMKEEENEIILFGHQVRPEGIFEIWNHRFPEGTRGDWISKNRLVTLDQSGLFQLIDLNSGKILQKHDIPINRKFATLSVEEFGEKLLFMTNRYTRAWIAAKRVDYDGFIQPVTSLDGEVMLLDSKGPIWPSMASLQRFDFVHNQPESTPAFMFKRTAGLPDKTELVFLRASDGSLIRFHKPLPYDDLTTNVIFENAPGKSRLQFNFGYHWLGLELTDVPRPPEPPAQVGLPDKNSREAEKSNGIQSVDEFADSSNPFETISRELKSWVKEEQAKSPLGTQKKQGKIVGE